MSKLQQLVAETNPILILMINGVVEVAENKAIVVNGCKYETHEEAVLREAKRKSDGDGKPKRIAPRQGRNEKCACGSGKKFKHCCIS